MFYQEVVAVLAVVVLINVIETVVKRLDQLLSFLDVLFEEFVIDEY